MSRSYRAPPATLTYSLCPGRLRCLRGTRGIGSSGGRRSGCHYVGDVLNEAPPGPLLPAIRPVTDRAAELHEEFGVAAGFPELVEEVFDGVLAALDLQRLAESPDDGQLLGIEQQLLLAGTGRVDVHGGEHPAVRDLAVQLQLGVPGRLVLLEDHRVTGRTGLHHGGGDDGQGAAVLD